MDNTAPKKGENKTDNTLRTSIKHKKQNVHTDNKTIRYGKYHVITWLSHIMLGRKQNYFQFFNILYQRGF